MYRQYKQEILLAYNDFEHDMIVDEQHGYAKGYFDNYRKQMIFTTEWTLDYLMGDHQMTTTTNDVTGYVYQVWMNEGYQIGIEMLDIDRNNLGQGDFDGARMRIIDLKTDNSRIITGFPSHTMLAGHYVYCNNYDTKNNRFLDIIDVEKMTHVRLSTNDHDFTFFYQMGKDVFVQDAHTETTFLIKENQLIEQPTPAYNVYPNIDEGSGSEMLKDIAPINSGEHWYVNPLKQYGAIYWAELLKFSSDKVARVFIDFARDDIIQIVDVANYGKDYVAILYETRMAQGEPVREYVSVYDMSGNMVQHKEMTELVGDKPGRFTALDYLE
jgi:hypothetical protein